MIAMCVDDEPLLLRKMKRVVASSEYITETAAFEDEEEAICWAQEHEVDIAFLDIRLHEMSGIEVCERLKRSNPKLYVVFCTGWSDYTMEAFRVHANGYLMKPVKPEEVKQEIERLVRLREAIGGQVIGPRGRQQETALTVSCGGSFEVHDRDGRPVTFRRRKAKDLLRVLIDFKGESKMAWEICEKLWSGETDTWSESRQTYFYILMSELKKALSDLKAERVLVRESDGYRVNMDLIRIRK